MHQRYTVHERAVVFQVNFLLHPFTPKTPERHHTMPLPSVGRSRAGHSSHASTTAQPHTEKGRRRASSKERSTGSEGRGRSRGDGTTMASRRRRGSAHSPPVGSPKAAVGAPRAISPLALRPDSPANDPRNYTPAAANRFTYSVSPTRTPAPPPAPPQETPYTKSTAAPGYIRKGEPVEAAVWCPPHQLNQEGSAYHGVHYNSVSRSLVMPHTPRTPIRDDERAISPKRPERSASVSHTVVYDDRMERERERERERLIGRDMEREREREREREENEEGMSMLHSQLNRLKVSFDDMKKAEEVRHLKEEVAMLKNSMAQQSQMQAYQAGHSHAMQAFHLNSMQTAQQQQQQQQQQPQYPPSSPQSPVSYQVTPIHQAPSHSQYPTVSNQGSRGVHPGSPPPPPAPPRERTPVHQVPESQGQGQQQQQPQSQQTHYHMHQTYQGARGGGGAGAGANGPLQPQSQEPMHLPHLSSLRSSVRGATPEV